ncbi:MAG: NAD-dependent succinate-semialdehyde dehydrogenase [Gammaproteobacteria bacterium]|nr:NAD-dependent succinate-semialdehyde dehydrogenase [Gammaproteobacteria bacterium]MCH9743823.1 NAD-dependent succinate-semialdehyde dehydrogenase [Gammaproteobacteria bacterium]
MELSNPKLFKTQNFINGKWQPANNKETFEVLNPFNQQKIADVPLSGATETEEAIDAAHNAWPAWRDKTAKQRADILNKWADLIDSNIEDLAQLMTAEGGKPIKESRGEIAYGNSFIRWFAGEAERIDGDVIAAPKSDARILALKQPIGVVAAITPWNFPNAMITRKCAPALAAGCTVIVKPAEDTPLSAFALAELAAQAGIPDGVFNIVTGNPEEIGTTLCESPIIRKLSFTGSTRVGKLLMKQSADTVKKLSLELGGNAPFIVFDDADLDAAVDGLMASKFRNTGQTCICANRIYLQNTIAEPFIKKLKSSVSQLKIGDGANEDTTQSVLINQAGMDKVMRLVEDAKQHDATVIMGGKPAADISSLSFEPTILTGITNKMAIYHEEIFGPVVAIQQFETEEEVVRLANDTPFGLASYFYTNNNGRVWRVSEGLEYGIVGANSGAVSSAVGPFGGVKESGLGREGSKYGIEDFLEIKQVYIGGV